MKLNFTLFFISLLLSVYIMSCKTQVEKVIKPEEVSAWCIIGFDTEDRTPEQRIDLLKHLGLTKYGYNRGKGDLTQMLDEFELAHENNIEINSVFLWLNAKRDSLGALSPGNQQILTNLSKVKQKPAIWVSFSDNFFKELDDEHAIDLASEMIKFVKSEADKLGCTLALYNHHGWFGNPMNQIKILEQLGDKEITLAYNFHHSHDYVDKFDRVASAIVPHLSYVNLNGVKKDGPQILDLGEGDHELEMISMLMQKGYQGPWGILGHIKTEDVKVVLERNLSGLEKLNRALVSK